MPPLYPGLFKNRYQSLKGRNWLTAIPEEDRKAFSEIGLTEQRARNINIHQIGGKAAAKKAKRDRRGRFTSDHKHLEQKEL